MDGSNVAGDGPEAILDRVSEGVLALDEDLVYTYANDGALDLLGMDRGDIVGQYIWDLFPEAENTVAGERIESALSAGEKRTYERYSEPQEKWFEVTVYPDADGLAIVFRDVTERKQRESELKQYEHIVENLPVAVGESTADGNGGFRSVNSAAVEMFGAESKAELRDYSLTEAYVDPAERKAVREQLRQQGAIDGQEVRLERLSGEEFWGSITASDVSDDGDEMRFIGIIEEVTERKERERQLRRLHEATQEIVAMESPEEVARRASAAASDILDIEANGVHFYDESADALVPVTVSETAQDLLGEPPELDAGVAWKAYQTGETLHCEDVRTAEDVYNDDTEIRSELLVPLNDHGVFIFSSTAVDAFSDDDIRVAKLLAKSTETAISARHKEKQLREHDRELQQAETLFENAQDAFFVIDVEGEGEEYRIERVNPAYESLTGLDSDTIQGRTIRDVFGQEVYSDIEAHYDECVRREEPIAYVEQLDIPEPGSYWDSRIAPVIVDGEVVQIVGATRNVTAQKAYEQRLEEQRDGLELLNEMVRHDIRNDLQVIASYAELLATRVDEDDREYVERILNNAQTAVELTRSARDLAGTMLQTQEGNEATPLRQTLLAQIDDIRTSYADAVLSVDGDIPSVTVEADEMLPSVFRNILKNAIQHNDKEVPEVSVSVDVSDDEVSVSVRDNGPGIPDAQKDDVFGKGEKGLESEGTGIGLYLVNTLVDKYGGRVRVDDNEPTGTIVTVTLNRA